MPTCNSASFVRNVRIFQAQSRRSRRQLKLRRSRTKLITGSRRFTGVREKWIKPARKSSCLRKSQDKRTKTPNATVMKSGSLSILCGGGARPRPRKRRLRSLSEAAGSTVRIRSPSMRSLRSTSSSPYWSAHYGDPQHCHLRRLESLRRATQRLFLAREACHQIDIQLVKLLRVNIELHDRQAQVGRNLG